MTEDNGIRHYHSSCSQDLHLDIRIPDWEKQGARYMFYFLVEPIKQDTFSYILNFSNVIYFIIDCSNPFDLKIH